MLAERRLQRDLEHLQDNLAKLMTDFNALAKEKGSAVVDNVKEELATDREKIQQLIASAETSLKGLQERAKEATQDVERTIVDHPIASVAAALGIGYFLGKLLSPGRR